MTISANQPYFRAYFPYWQLIHAADVFLISDDYAYTKRTWVNRNKILVNGQVQYFRVEISKASVHKQINETTLLPIDTKHKLRTIQLAYHKAPYFDAGYELMENILCYDNRNLASFLTHSIQEICQYLGITTTLAHTSQLEGNRLLKREERIYDFCQRFGADHYINAIGGQALYSFKEFEKRGIHLSFIYSETGDSHTESMYKIESAAPIHFQKRPPFLKGLSIIDAIMHNSPEKLHRLLDCYTLIDNDCSKPYTTPSLSKPFTND